MLALPSVYGSFELIESNEDGLNVSQSVTYLPIKKPTLELDSNQFLNSGNQESSTTLNSIQYLRKKVPATRTAANKGQLPPDSSMQSAYRVPNTHQHQWSSASLSKDSSCAVLRNLRKLNQDKPGLTRGRNSKFSKDQSRLYINTSNSRLMRNVSREELTQIIEQSQQN